MDRHRNFKGVFLLVLYLCAFTMFWAVGNDISQSAYRDPTNQIESFSKSSLFNIPQNYRQTNPASVYSLSFIKAFFNDISIIHKNFDHRFNIQSEQYDHQISNIEPGLLTTVIIYPFHYFW